MRWVAVLGGVLVTAAAVAANAQSPSPLDALGFLLGEWQAQGSGAAGSSVGSFTFTRELQDHVIVRRSFSETVKTAGQAGARHDDLMVIHVDDAGAVRADYFDSEGHTIRYLVTATAGREAVFVSESMESTSSYRLTYSLDPDGSLNGKFEMAFPDRPDLFAQYLAWTARRAAPKDAPAHP